MHGTEVCVLFRPFCNSLSLKSVLVFESEQFLKKLIIGEYQIMIYLTFCRIYTWTFVCGKPGKVEKDNFLLFPRTRGGDISL